MSEINAVQTEINMINERSKELKDSQKGKKEEDIPTAEKSELNDLEKKQNELKAKKESIYSRYANDNKIIRQLIDLALLQNNMLKGEALNNFIKRSIELI